MELNVDTILDNGEAPSEPTGGSTRWEGYSNYRALSWQINKTVHRAIEAATKVQRYHVEGEPIQPATAAEASARIIQPALIFIPEMEQDRETVDLYDGVLEKWTEDYRDGKSLIELLSTVRLQEECPGWIYDYVLDLKRVAWELGYLRSGRWSHEHSDPTEGESEAMFQGG